MYHHLAQKTGGQISMTRNIKVHVLHTGSVIVDSALPFNHKKNLPFTWQGIQQSRRKQMRLPVSIYLIDHPKGLVLIDTGWDTSHRHQNHKQTASRHLNKVELPQGQAVHEQLLKLGIQISDIDYVVLSHLHLDHVSGLRHVSDANNIIVSDEEWSEANNNKSYYESHMWNNIPIDTFPLEHNGVGPTGKSFDLFNDGTVEFIHTPGHSAGHCATRIKSHKDAEQFLLLASNVGYSEPSWKHGILPKFVEDKDDAINSLNWIKVQSCNPNCIEVIANHDPHVEPKIINL